VGKKSNLPPLGILTVAAGGMEPKSCGHEYRPLEGQGHTVADYVFISAMNIQRDSTRSVAHSRYSAAVENI